MKNSILQQLHSEGHTFSIVYLKKYAKSITIAIKVSPTIRHHVLQRGKIFVGNSCCHVHDRLNVLQCFHCQAIGHLSNNCPNQTDNPICLYCSQQHRSSTCQNKKDLTNHACINCKNSKLYSSNFLHTANSQNCPFIIEAMNRIQQKTDYTSKNAI